MQLTSLMIRSITAILLSAELVASAQASRAAGSAQTHELAQKLVAANEGFWRSCREPAPELSSRGLFTYALLLCEAGEHLERLERLFDLAAHMQVAAPKDRAYGNFRWYWRETKVRDYNAVDFCMRGGALLWLKHRQRLPPATRQQLRALLDLAVEGSLRHKVPESYSNIALMNASNLILLGEALENPQAAEAGYARLQKVLDYTAANGVHEFVSPTYTGVDLDGLVMLEAYTRNAKAREQARALLDLLWTDIALNWFPPAHRLAGAQSRTYDFLHGHGYLDVQLSLNGWYDQAHPREMDTIYGAQARWHPAQELRRLSEAFPRLVRQSWGPEPWQSRTHYLLPDVTLSTSASSYGGWTDMPLTVDFAGSPLSPRCYFIADGRHDAYGKEKIPAGAHQKALHLNPFWTAAQDRVDALCLVIYRPKDVPTNATVLGSNFVMPADADEFRVGDEAVSLARETRVPVKPGEAVFARKGSAIVGIRVLWSRSCAGRTAPAFLVNDGNPYGAVRLLIEHAAPGKVPAACTNSPGAVLWLRVGGGLTNEPSRRDFMEQFHSATGEMITSVEGLRARASGLRGDLGLEASAPWSQPGRLQPAPSRAVLENNGKDVGRDILTPAS